MAATRYDSAQNETNRCDQIISSIDYHLNAFHEAFAVCFANGQQKPIGDTSIRLRVFEDFWQSLSATKAITFESVEILNKYFNNYKKNLHLHIQDNCDFQSQFASAERVIISTSQMNVFRSIVSIYHEFMKYRFYLSQFRENTPEKISQHITELNQACDAIEHELIFINSAELAASRAMMATFIELTLKHLNSKNHMDVSVNLSADKKSKTDQFLTLDILLDNLPSVTQLNEIIHHLQEAKKAKKPYEHYRKELLVHTSRFEAANHELILVAETLKRGTVSLNHTNDIETTIQPYLDKLSAFDSVLLTYKLIADLSGFDALQKYNNNRYSTLQSTVKQMASDCASQSLKPWQLAAERVKIAETDTIKRLTSLCGTYEQQISNIDTIRRRIGPLIDNQQTIENERTILAARISQAQGVLHLAAKSLTDTVITLNGHTETQLTYTKEFFLRHWGKLCIGGGVGTSFGTGVGYLAVAAPQIAIIAATGLIIGSCVSAGIGLVNDQLHPEKQENLPENTSLILVTKEGKPKANSEKPVIHWYSPFMLFRNTWPQKEKQQNKIDIKPSLAR